MSPKEIPDELIDQLLAGREGPGAITGPDGLLKQLTKRDLRCRGRPRHDQPFHRRRPRRRQGVAGPPARQALPGRLADRVARIPQPKCETEVRLPVGRWQKTQDATALSGSARRRPRTGSRRHERHARQEQAQ